MHRKQIGQVVKEPEAQGAIYPDQRLAHGEFLLVKKGPQRCIQPPMSSRRISGGMVVVGGVPGVHRDVS